MVNAAGGEILVSRLWTEQKLAYTINGHRKGTYWLTYFKMDSGKLTEFNRACRLNDHVLRHLAIRLEPRLVDILVSHASGEKSPDAAPPEETTPAEDADQEGELAAQSES